MKLSLALLLCAASAASARTEEKLTLDKEPMPISAVAFSPDGKLLATAAYSNRAGQVKTDKANVKIYDVTTGKRTRTIPLPATALRFSPDGKLLAIGTPLEDHVVWDLAADKARWRFDYDDPAGKTGAREQSYGAYEVSDMQWAGDGKLLAATYLSGSDPARVYDVAAGKRVVRIATSKLTNQPVSAVSISGDGKLLATTGGDAKTELWSLPDGKHVATVGPGGAAVALTPDGKRLAVGLTTATDDPTLLVYDTASQKQVGELAGKHKDVTSLDFSADGKRLASAGSESFVRVWSIDHVDAASAQLIGHEGAISCVAISPDGKHVAAGSEDQTIKLWDVPEDSK